MHNHEYENEVNLHVNEMLFSCERVGTTTRFEDEAKGNSEMAYLPLYSLKCREPHHLKLNTVWIESTGLNCFLAIFQVSMKFPSYGLVYDYSLEDGGVSRKHSRDDDDEDHHTEEVRGQI